MCAVDRRQRMGESVSHPCGIAVAVIQMLGIAGTQLRAAAPPGQCISSPAAYLLGITGTTAAEAVLMAAEDRGPMMHAHIGMLQALHHDEVRQFNPDAKDHHWGKRKLRRDR